MLRFTVAALVCLLTACASGAGADPPAVAARDPVLDMPGYVYASQHCAGCHAVRRGETLSPNPDATPFQTIADTPGMTGYALTVWLTTSHPTMPNFIVRSEDVEQVWDYLAALKSAPK